MPLMIIDDSSPSIEYSGQWMSGGIDQEYNHTTHGSSTKGANATVSFTGQSIKVYGTIGRDHNNGDPAFAPITIYTIDGENYTTTFAGTPGADTLYKQLFYQSPKLRSGQHELVVTLTTSDMNMMWIDYFQVERPRGTPPGFIAAVIVGGVVGLMLLIIIGILLRRISHLQRQTNQYGNFPRKEARTYWPWMSRSPGHLTPFGSDSPSDAQPLTGTIRPFPLQYFPYSTVSSIRTSLSGYLIRGDAPPASKTFTRESTSTGYTSLSGYTTQAGTWADTTVPSTSRVSSSTSVNRQSNTTIYTSYSGYTVQGTTQAEKTNHPSRPASETSAPLLTNPSSVPRPQLFSGETTTNRVVVEGEEAPPAYYTDPFNSILY